MITYNLICPQCNVELAPRVFAGYYDRFTCWTCACTVDDKFIPGSTILAGAYGWGTEGSEASIDDIESSNIFYQK